MAYKISDECISCGACAAESPVEAISEGADRYVIDAHACIDCGNSANVSLTVLRSRSKRIQTACGGESRRIRLFGVFSSENGFLRRGTFVNPGIVKVTLTR
jgi:ferredoxin